MKTASSDEELAFKQKEKDTGPMLCHFCYPLCFPAWYGTGTGVFDSRHDPYQECSRICIIYLQSLHPPSKISAVAQDRVVYNRSLGSQNRDRKATTLDEVLLFRMKQWIPGTIPVCLHRDPENLTIAGTDSCTSYDMKQGIGTDAKLGDIARTEFLN